MPPRSERKQELLDFVQNELDKYKSGEIKRLTPGVELAKRFDYSQATIATYLSIKLAEERKAARVARAEDFIVYLREEAQQLQAGEIVRLSSYDELKTRSGYSLHKIRELINREGLAHERGDARTAKRQALIDHARQETEEFRARQRV